MAQRPQTKDLKTPGRLLTEDDVRSRARSTIGRIPFDPYGFPVVVKSDGQYLRQVWTYLRKRSEALFALTNPSAKGYAHAYGIGLDFEYNRTTAATKALPPYKGAEPGEIDYNRKAVEKDGRSYETWLKAFNLGRQDGLRLKQYHLAFRATGVYPSIKASSVLQKGLTLEASDPESDLRVYPEMQYWPICASRERSPAQARRVLDRLAKSRDFLPPFSRRISLKDFEQKGAVDFDNSGVMDVPLDKIASHQPGVTPGFLRKMLRGETKRDGSPTFYYIKNKDLYYLHDGNHRVAEARLLRKKTISGYVYGKPMDVTASLGQLAALDGTKYFSKRALEYAGDATVSRKSRETIISLTPDEFLSMAETLRCPNAGKIARVTSAKTEFSDVPFLIFENLGNGTAKVVGHEGRHRMMFLKAQGVKHVPVIFKSIAGKGPSIRWGSQEAGDFDKVDVWPEWLMAERDSKSMPFPMSLIYPRNEITASLEIVYHATSLYNLVSMLTQKRIKLSTTLGTSSDRSTNERPFFMSLTRTRVGGYHTRATGHGQCLLELDYDYLRSRYRVEPRDYWGPEFRKANQNINEMEETLTTNKSEIPLPKPAALIKNIDILWTDMTDDRGSNAELRSLLILLKKLGIPFRIYDNANAWKTGSLKQLPLAGLIPRLKGQERQEYGRQKRDYFAEYKELMNVPDRNKLSKRAARILSDLNYDYDFDNVARRLENELHNSRRDDTAVPIVQAISKAGGLKPFLQTLRDRFKGQKITAAVDLYPYGYWITHDGVRLDVDYEEHARTARMEMRRHYPNADAYIRNSYPDDEKPSVYDYADHAIYQLGWIRLVAERSDPKKTLLEVELSYGNVSDKAFEAFKRYIEATPFNEYFFIPKGPTVLQSAPLRFGAISSPQTLLHAVRKCVRRQMVTADSGDSGAWITHEGVTIPVPEEKHAEKARQWVIANHLLKDVVKGFGTDDYNAYDYVVQTLGWVRITVSGAHCEINFYSKRLSLPTYQVIARYLRTSAFTDFLVIAASRLQKNFAYKTFSKPDEALAMLYENIRSEGLTAMIEASEDEVLKAADFVPPFRVEKMTPTYYKVYMGPDQAFGNIKKRGREWEAELRNVHGDLIELAGLWNKRADAIEEVQYLLTRRYDHSKTLEGSVMPKTPQERVARILTASDKNIGRSWNSIDGIRTITGTMKVGAQDYYTVKGGRNKGSTEDLIKQSEIESEINLDARRLASRKEHQAAEKPEALYLRGFENTLVPMKRGKALSALKKGMSVRKKPYNSIRDAIEDLIKQGYTVVTRPDGTRRFQGPEGTFFDEKPFTKIGIDYAQYLIDNHTLEASEGQSYTNKTKDVKLIFYKNRSTAQTCKPGQTVSPKAGYGARTKVRSATPEEVKQLKAGKWLRTREDGAKATDKGAKQTKYRPWLTASARVEKHLDDLGLR